ncbi:hypothetical protein Aoki45_24560 [Algoriphagus sp. oki45]|uniref:hypothetical protein n=1 Tax=Algoriphagus sp. oki45 TaxID=3067294 RepID=UPI0027E95751|nr:hypothetical protein Aoki45_24560 [Algoriphagus sp. oki45]
MKFQEFSPKASYTSNEKVSKKFEKFQKLLLQLESKTLPEQTFSLINSKIQEIDSFQNEGDLLLDFLEKKQQEILRHLQKELKIVPKGYYRNQWMVVGMSAFGLPFGVVFGTTLDNMAFIGIGLPMGMAIGIGIGNGMDEKAKKEGRQIDLD